MTKDTLACEEFPMKIIDARKASSALGTSTDASAGQASRTALSTDDDASAPRRFPGTRSSAARIPGKPDDSEQGPMSECTSATASGAESSPAAGRSTGAGDGSARAESSDPSSHHRDALRRFLAEGREETMDGVILRGLTSANSLHRGDDEATARWHGQSGPC
ncbi:hypothetical protein UVI_02022270 [Ustilaginoidea virens]|uniref:Uncharacterized protein n=1 Tax=Ustilaginoidea virens TaxID=1159556 RepID=A0A1B5L0S1_USTVR|nr:hypothetical protein UVI_02022270 [Ustilaginoidea virens]